MRRIEAYLTTDENVPQSNLFLDISLYCKTGLNLPIGPSVLHVILNPIISSKLVPKRKIS